MDLPASDLAGHEKGDIFWYVVSPVCVRSSLANVFASAEDSYIGIGLRELMCVYDVHVSHTLHVSRTCV